MAVNMNNILVEHYGSKISIAQHKENGEVLEQSIMIVGGELDGREYKYDNTLTGLAAVLVQIEEEINREENE